MDKQIFISYSVSDKEKVRLIKKDIESVGHRVWIYPEAIEPSDNIVVSEKKGIEESDFVILMLSSKAKNATAVKKEIQLTRREEKIKGKKKLLIVKIDSKIPLRNKEAIQICDLSNKNNYAKELHKLLSKIKEHRNFSFAEKVIKRYKKEYAHWFRVKLKLKGANLKFVKEVDYHLHPDIAQDKNTTDSSRNPEKKFSISFDTPDNELVFAVVRLKDGTTEEIRHYVKFSLK